MFDLRQIPVIGQGVRHYREYVSWLLTSGNVTSVSPCLLGFSRWVFRLWSYIQVGRIKVVGADHLLTQGRVIFCPNHSSLLDALVVHSIMQRPVRYMGAYESLTGLYGLKTIICCKAGAFAVDRSNGKSVLHAATNLLISGEPMMVFPEGKIVNSGKLDEFKLGPGYITTAACEQLGDDVPVGLIPMYIHYHKRNVATGETFNFFKIGLSWRGGATVHVDEPVWVNRVPAEHRDPQTIMGLVRERVLLLQARAEAHRP